MSNEVRRPEQNKQRPKPPVRTRDAAKVEAFIIFKASGMSDRAAAAAAGYSQNPESAAKQGQRLMADPDIRARVIQLREQNLRELRVSEMEYLKETNLRNQFKARADNERAKKRARNPVRKMTADAKRDAAAGKMLRIRDNVMARKRAGEPNSTIDAGSVAAQLNMGSKRSGAEMVRQALRDAGIAEPFNVVRDRWCDEAMNQAVK